MNSAIRGARPEGISNRPIKQSGTLSAREIEVLEWVFLGKENIDIGMIMQLSTATVRNHLKSAFRKLDASTRTGAVWSALRRGVIDPPAVIDEVPLIFFAAGFEKRLPECC